MSFTANDAIRQAPITAAHYMKHGQREIDALFGDGYAAKHPELLIAFMDICERDFSFAIMVNQGVLD